MLEVVDLQRSFGRHQVLRDVSFEVPKGQIAGFLGPNGAGKTTTMRVLTTFLPPSAGSGRVEVAGFDVRSHPREVCRQVGYLPESMPIYPELTALEYLHHRARLKGIRGRQRRRRVRSVIETSALNSVQRTPLGILSKGYRQRVGLADALLSEPSVLILDEPTSGLDPRQVAEVRQLIGRLRESATVLLSSHILGEIEQVCDLVVVLAGGSVKASETREGWTERLLRAGRFDLKLTDSFPDTVQQLRELPGVKGVEKDGETFRIQSDRDVREDLFHLSVARGWVILELSSIPATFEDLFLEWVGEEGSSS